MTHVTIGVYANGDMKYNIVADEDLERHTQYNLDFRPGRAFFVDGVCKNQGYLSDEKVAEWTEKIKTMKFDFSRPTKPYQ